MVTPISHPFTVATFIYTPLKNAVNYVAAKIFQIYRRLSDAVLSLCLRNHYWVLHPRTYIAKIQIYMIKYFTRNKTTMLSCADVLPTLPVPRLKDSVEKYLSSIEPFVTDCEFTSIQTRSRYFVAEHGAALQKKLIVEAGKKRNWFEETWLKSAYLENRFSSYYTSWYGVDSIIPITNTYVNPQIDRAARILYLMLQYREKIRSGTISPLEGGVPICMEQFTKIFGANRVPGEVCDRLDVHSNSEHIIVLTRGKIFKLDIKDRIGNPLSEGGLAAALTKICCDTSHGDNVSVLTLQSRPEWAQHRQLLSADNQENLETIDTAILALRLSDLTPESDTDLADGLFKDERNLWIDKGITVTTFANGKVGGTLEHSMADATIVSKVMEWIYENENYPKDYHVEIPNEAPPTQILSWKLSNEMQKAQTEGQKKAKMMMGSVELLATNFQPFGKKAIQRWNCSPDSFVQMALQLAYFRMKGKIPFTYESGSTRMFYHGRTETIRSASEQSDIFCKLMTHPNVDVADKRLALKNAIKTHVAYKREAVSGQGCDRHFTALKRLSGNEDIAFFNSKDFNMPYDLATSQTPTRSTGGGGFGPSSPDGYGISYHIYPEEIRFYISKFKSNAKEDTSKMYLEILQALKDMSELYEQISFANAC